MKAVALLFALALVAACGNAPSSQRSYDTTAIEAAVEAQLADAPAIEGAGLIIVHREDGVLLEKGFGTHDVDRISLVASSSKAVTATVLLAIADRGLLDMDEPIAQVVGAWEGSNPEITTAQLLSNSSGLVGLSPEPAYPPYLCQYFFTGSLQECGDQIFLTEEDDDDVAPPDTVFRYGGGQWQLSGAVAEIVTGKSWETLVEEILVEPCGLGRFGFNNHFVQLRPSDAGPFDYPGGFDGNPDVLEPTQNPNMEGGLYTTIGDYGKILEVHLRGGLCGENRVLSEEAVARAHADRIGDVYGGSTGSRARGGYGLGWWVDRESRLLFDPGAYGSVAWLDEERGYGAFLVIEANAGLGSSIADRIRPVIEEAIDAAAD